MAANITLSSGVRQNLLSLQNTASLSSLTQNRLATGKKVNSALDNPLNFFTSQSLSNRASDLGSLLDSIGQAQQTLKAADQGISSLTKLVESAKSIAKQAQQASAPTATYSLSLAGNAAIATDSAAVATGTVTIGADVAATGTGTVTIADDVAANLTGTVTGLTGTDDLVTDLGLTAGDTVTISDGTNTSSYTVTGTDTVDDLVNGLNAGTADATVSLQSGALNVVSGNNSDTLTIGGTGATDTFGSTTTGGPTNSAVAALTGTLSVTQGSGPATTVDFSTVTTRAGLESALGSIGSFNGSDQLVLTASNNTDSITVSGTGTSVTGLGLSASYSATNATVAALTGTLSVTQGSGSATTVDFSSVTTRAGLQAALGGTASFNGANQLVLTASNNTDSFAISGTGTAASGLGLSATAKPTNSTIGGLSGSLSVQVGTGTAQTINFGSGGVTNRAELATALSGLTGVTASINGSNQISITSTSSDAVTIGGTNASSFFAAGSIGSNAPTTTVATPSATRENLQGQYNELLTQIDALAKDASYNGVNLLNGDDLKVIFNENGTSSQDVTGVDFTAQGLGLTALTGDAFQTNNDIDDTLSGLDAALGTLRTQAAKFGSNLTTVQTRQDFTKNMIDTLQTGADNLVLADTNLEGANLLALQTRQQLSTTALSLSAQADQAVLRLF